MSSEGPVISVELVGGLFHLSPALLKSFIPMQVTVGFFQCGVDLVSGVWSVDQVHSSSTIRMFTSYYFVWEK